MKKTKNVKVLKRAAAVLLVVGMLLAFAACGKKFDIEGQWKSVGTYGFGQAQPGVVITFRDDSCNFFSPRDNYVLLEENGNYTLQVTSLIGTTLNFEVNVIDSDNIEIGSGEHVTKLVRVK